jgi:heme oxygenase (biliverdin-IX-beta and delta-forming)
MSILALLKDRTRPEHEAIEGAFDLMRDDVTLASYRGRLEQFRGFLVPVEARLGELGGWGEHGIDLAARHKVPLLEADLRALGVESVGRLPVCREVPDLAGLAEGFGCLYVLEGSTLGGQFISRHVRRVLGVTPEAGGGFFHGYGERTGEMWRAFGAAVTSFAARGETRDRIVAGAMETFRDLRRWFERGNRS